MKNFKCFLLLSFLLLTQSKTESKTQKVLPKEYIGAWSIGSCEHYEKCGDMSDALMEISSKTLSFYEVTCDIQKVTKLKNHSLKLEVYCYEYGANRKESFFIQSISSQEIRIVGGVFATGITYVKCATPNDTNCDE